MIGRKNCRPFDRLLRKTESEMEQWLRENFSYENTPKSIFSARLSTVVFAMSNKLKMYFSKIVQKCLENALGYPVLFGFADQLILYGPVRVWANLGKSPESREDVIKWEKKLDFAKNDTNLSVSKVQEWVESANIFGLPKELTMDEVRQEINDWVGQDKPIRFPFDRELFEKEIENCPMLAGGPTQSFIDWVEEGNWARNGSANLGHIKFTMQDKSIRVKAAKNMVMYIRDYKDLAGYIMEEAKNREFEIGAIQKIEPKLKPRVAVSDNFINYMLTNYLFGDYSDRNIDDGNVLKESVKKTMKRYENRLKLLDNTYCVSWDWSGFDRWPELKDVVRTVIPLIRSNLTGIGDEQLLAWKNMRGKFVIVTKQGEEVYRKKVQGGITSGDFLTNYMDTIYNRAAVLTAAKLGKVNLLSYDLKGDDVMAIFPTYDDAITWVEEMQRANIEAKVDIFGVAQGRGEFLRQLLDARERIVAGYPLRLAWWLTKDWNPPSSNDTGRVNKSVAGIQKIKDRVGDINTVLETYLDREVTNISRRNKIQKDFVTAPSTFGGLGISVHQWGGSAPVFANRFRFFKSAKKPTIKLDNAEAAISNWGSKLQEYQLTSEELQQIAELDLVNKVSTNHYTKAARKSQKEYIKPKVFSRIRGTVYQVSKDWEITLDRIRDIARIAQTGVPLKVWLAGSYVQVQKVMNELNLVKQVRSVKIVDEIDKIAPGFKVHVNDFERRGLSRKQAIDYLVLGKTPFYRVRIHELVFSIYEPVYQLSLPLVISKNADIYATQLRFAIFAIEDVLMLSEQQRMLRV